MLQVTQQGSVPRISMRKHHRVFIQLSCSSENWFPEPHMLWTVCSGKEITSAERHKQKEGGVLYSITSHMRIGMGQLEGITCVVMSQNQGTKMESTLQMTVDGLSTLTLRNPVSQYIRTGQMFEEKHKEEGTGTPGKKLRKGSWEEVSGKEVCLGNGGI
ncbi:butyrophilin-like protein 2 [Salvelinus alpinus]